MTPSEVRKKIEALARERDLLLGTVAEAERRADALIACPLGPAVHRMAKPPQRLVRLVLESHNGTAFVPIPKRSTSP